MAQDGIGVWCWAGAGSVLLRCWSQSWSWDRSVVGEVNPSFSAQATGSWVVCTDVSSPSPPSSLLL